MRAKNSSKNRETEADVGDKKTEEETEEERQGSSSRYLAVLLNFTE